MSRTRCGLQQGTNELAKGMTSPPEPSTGGISTSLKRFKVGSIPIRSVVGRHAANQLARTSPR